MRSNTEKGCDVGKTFTRRVLMTAAAALAAVGMVGSAGAVSPQPEPLAEPVTLTIGAARVGHHAPLPGAAKLLEEMNIELEVAEFVRYADARTALATGSLDLATVGPADLPIALSQDIDTIVALMGVGSSPKYPVVRNGVDVEEWGDLVGKRIAIAPGSAVWFQFVATLQEAGVDYGDLDIVNIQGGGANFNQALERGDVDIIITWEPFESTPVVEGYGYWAENLDYSVSEAVGAELGMIAVTRDALETKRDAVERFIWAYAKRQEELAADQAAFAEAVAEFTGISSEISERIAESIELGAVLSLEQMQRQASTFHELGVIEVDVSDQLPEYFAADLVREVIGE